MKYIYKKPENESWGSISTMNVIIFAFISLGLFFMMLIDLWKNNFLLTSFIFWFIMFFAFFVSFYIYYRKQISINVFEINNSGIVVENKTYKWKNVKTFHWFGEAQSERAGFFKLGNLGPVILNINNFSEYSIAKVKVRKFIFSKYINLKINAEDKNIFIEEMASNGVKKTATWRHYVGI